MAIDDFMEPEDFDPQPDDGSGGGQSESAPGWPNGSPEGIDPDAEASAEPGIPNDPAEMRKLMTRKTQELAEARKSLETERREFEAERAAAKAARQQSQPQQVPDEFDIDKHPGRAHYEKLAPEDQAALDFATRKAVAEARRQLAPFLQAVAGLQQHHTQSEVERLKAAFGPEVVDRYKDDAMRIAHAVRASGGDITLEQAMRAAAGDAAQAGSNRKFGSRDLNAARADAGLLPRGNNPRAVSREVPVKAKSESDEDYTRRLVRFYTPQNGRGSVR